MTNHEILEIFRDRKVIEVKDYRPLDADLLPKNKQGIIIWTEQGDALVFFFRGRIKQKGLQENALVLKR